MTIDEYIEWLMGVPEYKILEFTMSDTQIKLFVSETTTAQSEIPFVAFGRNVSIHEPIQYEVLG